MAKARYSDPAAADYIARTLIKRRDKVLRTWLTGVNPIVEPQLSAAGVLTFENAAVDAGVATAPAGVRADLVALRQCHRTRPRGRPRNSA